MTRMVQSDFFFVKVNITKNLIHGERTIPSSETQ